jgi:hypothetical protein
MTADLFCGAGKLSLGSSKRDSALLSAHLAHAPCLVRGNWRQRLRRVYHDLVYGAKRNCRHALGLLITLTSDDVSGRMMAFAGAIGSWSLPSSDLVPLVSRTTYIRHFLYFETPSLCSQNGFYSCIGLSAKHFWATLSLPDTLP